MLRRQSVVNLTLLSSALIAPAVHAQDPINFYTRDLPLVSTRAWAISPSGSTVVGHAGGRWFNGDTGPFAQVFESPLATSPWLPYSGELSSVRAVSPDDRFVAGAGSTFDGPSSAATIWDLQTGQVHQFGTGTIYGLSEGAAVAVGRVGRGTSASGPGAVAWQDGQLRTLSTSPYSSAQAVSQDGQVIVGFTGSYAAPRGAVWTSAGETLLPLPPGAARSAAYAMSADGGVIIGYAGEHPGASGDPRGWLTAWTRNAAGEYTPTTYGDGSMSLYSYMLFDDVLTAAVSPDGSVIGGTTSWQTPSIWSAATGLVPLNQLFAEYLTSTWTDPDGSLTIETRWLTTVNGIAGDNRTIIGGSSWITSIPDLPSTVVSGPWAFRATVPTPGTALVLGVAGAMASRHRRSMANR